MAVFEVRRVHAQLCEQAGEHIAALEILALVLGDVKQAEAYCAEHAGPEGYHALLDMLLQPGEGRKPLLVDACHLLAAGGTLLVNYKMLSLPSVSVSHCQVTHNGYAPTATLAAAQRHRQVITSIHTSS